MKKHCKDCKHLWTEGTKGDWCCLYGRKAVKAIGHCKLNGGKSLKVLQAQYGKSLKVL